MTVNEWPPRVWHGVVDPVTGDKIPPIKMEEVTNPSVMQEYNGALDRTLEDCTP